MNGQSLNDRVRRALSRVRTRAGAPDLVSDDRIRALEVDDDGNVRVEIELRADETADVADTARLVLSGVDGVREVSVTVRAPSGAGPDGTVPASRGTAGDAHRGSRRALPVMGPAGTGESRQRSPGQVSQEEASRHPSEAEPLAGVRHVVAVSSGKGGVGKSTVSTNLAAAWARAGYRVGLLDADIYGPDIPTMFGAWQKPAMHEDKVIPIEAHGVKLMSLGFLVDEDTPAIWRGPIIMGIVRQFLHQVDWGELDYLVVDLPPGTGDAQLSLVQLVQVSGAVMVTTPQDVAVQGVLKGIRMFESVDVPVLGIVENMRGFACPDCGSVHEIFGSGGGEKLAASIGVPFLGAIPLGMALRNEGDRGTPTALGRPDSAEGRALIAVAEATEARIRELATEAPPR